LQVGYADWSVEGRYLTNLHWKETIPAVNAPGNVQIGSFSNFGATSLIGGAESKFDSWEANLRWQPLTWLTAFVGYREIKVSDSTQVTIQFPAFSALYTFSTPWKARGGQIGAEVRLFGPGTSWQPGGFFGDIDARVGYYNVKGDSIFSLLPSTGGSFNGGATYSANALGYELGATFGYRISPNIELRAGYRYLSIENVLFANDYFAQATANATQNANPSPRNLTMQMATFGTRIMFP